MVNPYYEHFKTFTGAGIHPSDQIGDVYRSVLYQRGYGYGNDFDYSAVHGLGFMDGIMRLFRLAMPAVKSGLQYLGKQAVTTAADVATDAILGRNVNKSAKERVSAAATNIVAKAPAFLTEVNKSMGLKRSATSIDTAGSRSSRPPAKKPKKKKRKIGRGLLNTYPGLEYF